MRSGWRAPLQWAAFLTIASLLLPHLAAEPAASGFAGTSACSVCHSKESSQQASSAHATALFRASNHPLADSFPLGKKLSRTPGYQFDFLRSGSEFRVRIADQVDVMDLPVEWAFGAGRQAVTFITRVNQEWYLEHYATYFTSSHSWGPTPGQESVRPETLPLAAGILYKTTDPNTGVLGCFECHSTGPVSFSPTGEVRLNELGVTCESCHGPGAEHAGAPSTKNIGSPARLSAVQLNQFCGKCHRPPASTAATVDWNNAWNVRHQPMYLNESACFRKSRGALSCLTCHDPHEPADRKPDSFYNSRCSACHSTSLTASSAAAAARPKPICLQQTPANCIDCHMPRVSPQTSLRFTNHWIGIYGSGAKLKPLR
jgi:Cytochrome c554 and c-prime